MVEGEVEDGEVDEILEVERDGPARKLFNLCPKKKKKKKRRTRVPGPNWPVSNGSG